MHACIIHTHRTGRAGERHCLHLCLSAAAARATGHALATSHRDTLPRLPLGDRYRHFPLLRFFEQALCLCELLARQRAGSQVALKLLHLQQEQVFLAHPVHCGKGGILVRIVRRRKAQHALL